MKNSAIEMTIEIVGSQAALAEEINKFPVKPITQQTISNWKKGAEIRSEYCSVMEAITTSFGHPVMREQFRPVDWMTIWPELSARRQRSRPSAPEEGARGANEAGGIEVAA